MVSAEITRCLCVAFLTLPERISIHAISPVWNHRRVHAGFAADQDVLALAGKDGRLLWVLTTGVDRPSCGKTYQDACRSISRAIMTAVDGDTLVVGAGRYGDLRGDGTFSQPGDERPACGSIVCVNKKVRIFSKYGATLTTIAGAGAADATVRILSSGVIFGAVDHGFTLTGGGSSGLAVGDLGLPVDDVQVVGNVALRNGQFGFSAHALGKNLLVAHNTATANGGDGFLLVACDFSPCGIVGSVTLSDNQSFQNDGGGGCAVMNTRAVIVRNVASNNPADGFAILGGDYQVRGNAFINNLFSGFSIASATLNFTGNTVAGNLGPGLFLEDGSFELHYNNIFGNAENPGISGTPNTGPPNCGVRNNNTDISATNNFWGAASGPGADPADNAGPGSGCDLGSHAITRVKPFATGLFTVTP